MIYLDAERDQFEVLVKGGLFNWKLCICNGGTSSKHGNTLVDASRLLRVVGVLSYGLLHGNFGASLICKVKYTAFLERVDPPVMLSVSITKSR